MHTAQILLTQEDVTERTRYLNARSTLRSLIRYGVVPVINENDTVSTEDIRLGDNDTLAGLVTNLVEADLLLNPHRSGRSVHRRIRAGTPAQPWSEMRSPGIRPSTRWRGREAPSVGEECIPS